ncbi:MAG: hypothetical protein JWP87_6054 [Labilithrix sp.]|nr:hypothetical protein [Labilithrix sp.]
MWTESSYPNTAALPLSPPPSPSRDSGAAAHQAPPRSNASDRSIPNGSHLTSGGKVSPADGQEHPRTEL